MKKTTVYLNDEEVLGLSRRAVETGKSQSELIREGVRRIIRPGPRRFHSMGIGRGGGTRIREIDPEELLSRGRRSAGRD